MTGVQTCALPICNFFFDDELLATHGVTDFEPYSVTPGTRDFIPDFFVD